MNEQVRRWFEALVAIEQEILAVDHADNEDRNQESDTDGR